MKFENVEGEIIRLQDHYAIIDRYNSRQIYIYDLNREHQKTLPLPSYAYNYELMEYLKEECFKLKFHWKLENIIEDQDE